MPSSGETRNLKLSRFASNDCPSWLEDYNADMVKIDGILDKIYPVGSYYISANLANPADTMGFGTWVRAAIGKTIVGVDVNDSNFNTEGKVGGEKTVVLTTEMLPSHDHSIPVLRGTANDAGVHKHRSNTEHNFIVQTEAGEAGSFIQPTTAGRGTPYNVAYSTTSSAAHAHTVYTTASTSGSTGSGAAHNNMPPYETAYIWKRTA